MGKAQHIWAQKRLCFQTRGITTVAVPSATVHLALKIQTQLHAAGVTSILGLRWTRYMNCHMHSIPCAVAEFQMVRFCLCAIFD